MAYIWQHSLNIAIIQVHSN